MTADVELLPLPPSPLVQMSWDGPGAEVRHTTVYTADQMHAYSRANLAPLQAENERLRAEVELWRHRAAIHKYRRKRLAEALRPFAALYQPDDIGHMSNDNPDSQGIYGVNGKAITLGDLRRAAALAQEDRND